jgi:hypothetical protein
MWHMPQLIMKKVIKISHKNVKLKKVSFSEVGQLLPWHFHFIPAFSNQKQKTIISFLGFFFFFLLYWFG